jgi:hypothetical protein
VIFDIEAGKEYALSLGNINFLTILSPQLGLDSMIYFHGISPRDPELKEQVRSLGKASGHVAILLYRLEVVDVYGNARAKGRPELVNEINAIPGENDVGVLQFSANQKRVVFNTSVSVGGGRLKERIYLVENGKARQVITTDILTKRISLSADGRTLLILGDPTRSGFGQSAWDIFLVDMDSGSIRSLPLRKRVGAEIQ